MKSRCDPVEPARLNYQSHAEYMQFEIHTNYLLGMVHLSHVPSITQEFELEGPASTRLTRKIGSGSGLRIAAASTSRERFKSPKT